MATFKRPVNVAALRDVFSQRDVGMTHPDNDGYIQIGQDGTIEIMASEGLGIIIDPYTRSINFYADTIKFNTKASDGIRWNRLSFNHRATNYTEPPFLEVDLSDMFSLFDGVDEILGD